MNGRRLLYCLMRQPGRVFTREEIIHATKGTDYPCTPKSVDVAIHHLRKASGPYFIQAVRGCIGLRSSGTGNPNGGTESIVAFAV